MRFELQKTDDEQLKTWKFGLRTAADSRAIARLARRVKTRKRQADA